MGGLLVEAQPVSGPFSKWVRYTEPAPDMGQLDPTCLTCLAFFWSAVTRELPFQINDRFGFVGVFVLRLYGISFSCELMSAQFLYIRITLRAHLCCHDSVEKASKVGHFSTDRKNLLVFYGC